MNSRSEPPSNSASDSRDPSSDWLRSQSNNHRSISAAIGNDQTFVGGKKGSSSNVGASRQTGQPDAGQTGTVGQIEMHAENAIEHSLDQIQAALNSNRSYREFPSGSERYKELAELARGGCGIVVRAFDRQLEREVVIKRILPGATDSRETQNRFLNEAKITGQLSHPGIVPVYEIGRNDSDGTPFYAMKWLQGSTLAVAITELRKLRNGPQKTRKTRELLGRFHQICQTLAYAHTMHVVHRDLKPANIFIGQFGETVVVDWGLAKQLPPSKDFECNTEENQPSGTNPRSSINDSKVASRNENAKGKEQPVFPADHESKDTIARPGSQRIKPRRTSHGIARSNGQSSYSQNDSDIATMQGTVMGTASYMSPEQARGDTASIRYASDVFSLGTILYEILTGRSPFRADTVNNTLANVATARYQPIRCIDRTIPRALAAICEKAMQLSPNNRYQNAGELAEDIQSFLADMPVAAFPEPLWVRIDRLAGKYKTVVRSVFGALITIAMISIIASVSILNSLQKEKTARAEAQQRTIEREIALSRESEAHRESLNQLQSARKAVDAWLIDLSGNLQFYPGLDPIRSQLLSSAADYYERLGQSNLETPFHHVEAARAQIRLGDVHRLSNHKNKSIECYKAALRILLELPPQSDASLRSSISIQRTNASIGLVLCAIEEADYSETIERIARETTENIQFSASIESHPRELVNTAIRARHVYARWLTASGKQSAATEILQSCEAPAEWLARNGGGTSDFHLCTTLLNDLGSFQFRENRFDAAKSTFEKLTNLYTDFLDSDNPRPDWLEGRADAHMKAGNCDLKRNDPGNATAHFLVANNDFNSAWKILYGEEFFRENLAISDANLGLAYLINGNRDLAPDTLRSAIAMLQWLVANKGIDSDRAFRIAQCYLWLTESTLDSLDEEPDRLLDRTSTILDYLNEQPEMETDASKLRLQYHRARIRRAILTRDSNLAKQRCDQALEFATQPEFETLDANLRAIHKAELELLRWQSQSPTIDNASRQTANTASIYPIASLNKLKELTRESNDATSANAFALYLRFVQRHCESPELLKAALHVSEQACERFPQSAEFAHLQGLIAWECGEFEIANKAIENARRHRRAVCLADEQLEHLVQTTQSNDSVSISPRSLGLFKRENRLISDQRFLEKLAAFEFDLVETEANL